MSANDQDLLFLLKKFRQVAFSAGCLFTSVQILVVAVGSSGGSSS